MKARTNKWAMVLILHFDLFLLMFWSSFVSFVVNDLYFCILTSDFANILSRVLTPGP
jgi:hypothetical protein